MTNPGPAYSSDECGEAEARAAEDARADFRALAREFATKAMALANVHGVNSQLAGASVDALASDFYEVFIDEFYLLDPDDAYRAAREARDFAYDESED